MLIDLHRIRNGGSPLATDYSSSIQERTMITTNNNVSSAHARTKTNMKSVRIEVTTHIFFVGWAALLNTVTHSDMTQTGGLVDGAI